MQPFDNRRPARYLRGLVGKPLRQVRMIMLHHVENRLLGQATMVLGKQLVQMCKFVVVQGDADLSCNAELYHRAASPYRLIHAPNTRISSLRLIIFNRESGSGFWD